MYGLKSQCIHDRKGRLVHCVSGEIGSMHDLTICKNSMDEVKGILQKESENEDDSETYWSILADSGYQGLQEYVDTILPHKKKPNKQLTKVQQKHNKDLGAERVICERYYGRLKTRYRIIATKYRNSRDEYSVVFKLCAALTNYNIILHPL